MSFDQRFWLRLATRSDAATDDEQRKQLSDLAKVGRGACRLTVVCEPEAAGACLDVLLVLHRRGGSSSSSSSRSSGSSSSSSRSSGSSSLLQELCPIRLQHATLPHRHT